MENYLFDSGGSKTSARKSSDGNPVTDVHIKSADLKEVTLHNNATATGNGSEFIIAYSKTLTLEVSGTATSHRLVFETCSASGTWYPIQGVRLSDFEMKTETTSKGEVWQFEVTGLEKFRARLVTVTGGNVVVKGRALA